MDGTSAKLNNLSSNIKVKDKNGNDITSKCTISAVSPCTVKTGSGKCTISNDTATFTSAGTYTIDYNVLYEDTLLPVSSTYVTVNKLETQETSSSTDNGNNSSESLSNN